MRLAGSIDTSGGVGPPLDDVVRALSADVGSLERTARAVVGTERARLTDWQVDQLRGGASGNPTSGGIFRVSGHLDLEHLEHRGDRAGAPWSVVLKVVRSPLESAPRDSPGDVTYWRREVEVFASHLLDDVQGVTVPRCFGVVDLPGATAWLWLEDLGDASRTDWSLGTYLVAARALARFHAPYLTGTPIPRAPWLQPGVLRRFHAEWAPLIEDLLARARGGSAAYAPLHPDRAAPDTAALLRIMADPQPLLDAAEAAPQTLCHHDACIDNLRVRPGLHGTPELVAFDWQMIGPGSIGSDLGQLLCEQAAQTEGRSATGLEGGLESAVLRTYWDELALAGAQIDLGRVRLAYAVEAALRQITWAFAVLTFDLESLVDDDPAAAAVIARFVETTSASHLPALARQALDLLRALD